MLLSRISVTVLILAITACSLQTTNEDKVQDEIAVEAQYTNEVVELSENAKIQKAMEFIQDTDDETVQDQIVITEIAAPPFMEEVRAERFANMMREYGLEQVETDEEGNVVGKRPGTEGEQTIVISAHLDTVFPEGTDVEVEVRNDTLFAPGITDDTRGLAVLLSLIKTMENLDIQTIDNIWFVGTVGEEGIGDLRGVKHLFEMEGENIDAFISVDGSNDSRIVNKALGSHRYRVTFEGPGGHSWGAFGTANPAHALGRAITIFEDNASEFVKNGPKTSYNIGRIGGGTSVNSIPFANWMEIDMRSESPEALQQIDGIMQDAMQKALIEANSIKTEGPDLMVDIDMIGNRPSGEIPVDVPFIQRALAVSEYFGKEPGLTRSSTDANVAISMGVPSMTLGGGGSSGGSHSLDEWYYNEDGYQGVQRVFMILMAEAGLSE